MQICQRDRLKRHQLKCTLTRARECGPELRARKGGGAESALPLPTQLL